MTSKDSLVKKHCVPCEGGVAPFTPEKIKKHNKLLSVPWDVVDHKKIRREFRFKNFNGSMRFVTAVADIAEKEGHHPDIYIFYNKVRLTLWTHAIGGLSINDFILAAKIGLLN